MRWTKFVFPLIICLNIYYLLKRKPIQTRFSWETKDFTVDDLLKPTTGIPLVLHNTYKSRTLPPKFKLWQQTWLDKNPDLRVILWTDEDNALFMRKFYPYWSPFYESFTRNIHRIDSVRYLLLHKFGGIYADLDTICLKRIDDLLKGDVVLASIANDARWDNDVPNAFMASKPNQPMWLYVWATILYKTIDMRTTGPEAITGPMMLFETLPIWQRLYNNISELNILPAGLVYGEDWRWPNPECLEAKESEEARSKCIAKHPGLYVLTVWTHSWEPTGFIASTWRDVTRALGIA